MESILWSRKRYQTLSWSRMLLWKMDQKQYSPSLYWFCAETQPQNLLLNKSNRFHHASIQQGQSLYISVYAHEPFFFFFWLTGGLDFLEGNNDRETEFRLAESREHYRWQRKVKRVRGMVWCRKEGKKATIHWVKKAASVVGRWVAFRQSKPRPLTRAAGVGPSPNATGAVWGRHPYPFPTPALVLIDVGDGRGHTFRRPPHTPPTTVDVCLVLVLGASHSRNPTYTRAPREKIVLTRLPRPRDTVKATFRGGGGDCHCTPLVIQARHL